MVFPDESETMKLKLKIIANRGFAMEREDSADSRR